MRCVRLAWLLRLVVVSLLLLVSPAAATTVVHRSLSRLAEEADAVVLARVAWTSSGWGTFQGAPAIVTTVGLGEETPLLGESPGTLTVFGGTLGERTMSLEGQPELREGQLVLLFLTHADVESPFVGIWQGVFEVRDGRVYRGERAVVDVVSGEVVLAHDNEPAMTAGAFLAEVERALARLRDAREEAGQ